MPPAFALIAREEPGYLPVMVGSTDLSRMPQPRSAHVLVLSQNLPYARDRRVRLVTEALRDAGYRVSVITPGLPNEPRRTGEGALTRFSYPPPRPASGAAGYVREYAYSLVRTIGLLPRVLRRGRVTIVHGCNPPDMFWLVALLLRPFGARYVFDQHDASPELYRSKFARPRPLVLRVLQWLERRNYRTAAHVIVTSEGQRRLALDRGDVSPDRVTIVRNGPEDTMTPGQATDNLRSGREHLAVYAGVVGDQDGTDLLVAAIDDFVHRLGRTDCQFAVVGDGDALPALRAEISRRGLDALVTTPGWVDDEALRTWLSTATVGLSPEPPTPLNSVSALTKVGEYLAFGLPVLAFDLPETRVTAGPAARYVGEFSPAAYADALADLLDDEAARHAAAQAGLTAIHETLAWSLHRNHYLSVIDQLVP